MLTTLGLDKSIPLYDVKPTIIGRFNLLNKLRFTTVNTVKVCHWLTVNTKPWVISEYTKSPTLTASTSIYFAIRLHDVYL